MKKIIITLLLITTLAILFGSCVTVNVHYPSDATTTHADSLQIESFWY